MSDQSKIFIQTKLLKVIYTSSSPCLFIKHFSSLENSLLLKKIICFMKHLESLENSFSSLENSLLLKKIICLLIHKYSSELIQNLAFSSSYKLLFFTQIPQASFQPFSVVQNIVLQRTACSIYKLCELSAKTCLNGTKMHFSLSLLVEYYNAALKKIFFSHIAII